MKFFFCDRDHDLIFNHLKEIKGDKTCSQVHLKKTMIGSIVALYFN